jgi:hypothetical protein
MLLFLSQLIRGERPREWRLVDDFTVSRPALLQSAVMREWLRLAADPTVVRRGLAFSAVVGTVLVAVNHGDALMQGDISIMRAVKMIVTMLIPYCVSTISSVGAMQTARRDRETAPRI